MLTNEQMQVLVESHFITDGYSFSDGFEHRVDPDSSAITYSLVKDYKPQSILEIGTWDGGISCIIMAALIKNDLPFDYTASELLPDKAIATMTHVHDRTRKVPNLLGDITKNLKHVPRELDMLFLDSDHDSKTTNWVIKHIFPRIKKGGLFITHDWAVTENENGEWIGKGPNGAGSWPETQILMDLYKEGKFPFKKVFWNYMNPLPWELGAFEKI